MRAQYFHYRILETKPIQCLEEFKDHPRLRVFHQKGCKCVECGIEATQIGLGLAKNNGGKHWDLYTNDFYPLTVDHIHPRSRGGTDDLDNLQPMCYKCNQRKGSKIDGEPNIESNSLYSCLGHYCKWPRKPNKKKEDLRELIEPQLGWVVYKREGSKRLKNSYRKLGTISVIGVNPHTNRPAVQVEDKPGSWFHYSQLKRMKE